MDPARDISRKPGESQESFDKRMDEYKKKHKRYSKNPQGQWVEDENGQYQKNEHVTYDKVE